MLCSNCAVEESYAAAECFTIIGLNCFRFISVGVRRISETIPNESKSKFQSNPRQGSARSMRSNMIPTYHFLHGQGSLGWKVAGDVSQQGLSAGDFPQIAPRGPDHQRCFRDHRSDSKGAFWGDDSFYSCSTIDFVNHSRYIYIYRLYSMAT